MKDKIAIRIRKRAKSNVHHVKEKNIQNSQYTSAEPQNEPHPKPLKKDIENQTDKDSQEKRLFNISKKELVQKYKDTNFYQNVRLQSKLKCITPDLQVQISKNYNQKFLRKGLHPKKSPNSINIHIQRGFQGVLTPTQSNFPYEGYLTIFSMKKSKKVPRMHSKNKSYGSTPINSTSLRTFGGKALQNHLKRKRKKKNTQVQDIEKILNNLSRRVIEESSHLEQSQFKKGNQVSKCVEQRQRKSSMDIDSIPQNIDKYRRQNKTQNSIDLEDYIHCQNKPISLKKTNLRTKNQYHLSRVKLSQQQKSILRNFSIPEKAKTVLKQKHKANINPGLDRNTQGRKAIHLPEKIKRSTSKRTSTNSSKSQKVGKLNRMKKYLSVGQRVRSQ